MCETDMFFNKIDLFKSIGNLHMFNNHTLEIQCKHNKTVIHSVLYKTAVVTKENANMVCAI